MISVSTMTIILASVRRILALVRRMATIVSRTRMSIMVVQRLLMASTGMPEISKSTTRSFDCKV